MEKHNFKIGTDYRGHHWKGYHIYNVTKVKYITKTYVLMNQNIFLNTGER